LTSCKNQRELSYKNLVLLVDGRLRILRGSIFLWRR